VVRARGDLIDPAGPGEALELLAGLGVDAARLRVLGGPAGVAKLKAAGARADCEVGGDLTARLGLPEAVRQAVLDSFERFDGRGVPAGRAGCGGLPARCGRRVPRARRGAAAPGRPGACRAARVLAGFPLGRAAARAVLEAAGRSPAVLPSLPAGLTERELEVLRLLAAGRTKPQIAAGLVISPSTVQTHTVRIYAKCGVWTRAGLAMFAMRHGLAARTGPAAAAGID